MLTTFLLLRRVRDDLRRGPPPPYRSSEHLPEVIMMTVNDGDHVNDYDGDGVADYNIIIIQIFFVLKQNYS